MYTNLDNARQYINVKYGVTIPVKIVCIRSRVGNFVLVDVEDAIGNILTLHMPAYSVVSIEEKMSEAKKKED